MTWNDFSILLTAIATAGLVYIGYRQTKIQKKQTEIQSKSLDISLLEQRLQCFYDINVVRAEFLSSPVEVNKQVFYNVVSGVHNPIEIQQKADATIKNFAKAVLNSKNLFNKTIYEKLCPATHYLVNIQTIQRELIYRVSEIVDLANDKEKETAEVIEARKKVIILENIKNKLLKGYSNIDEEIILLCDMNVEEYNNNLTSIKEIFSDDDLFNSFDKYLEIKEDII